MRPNRAKITGIGAGGSMEESLGRVGPAAEHAMEYIVNTLAHRVSEYAKDNIQEGNQFSSFGYQLTGRLANSIKVTPYNMSKGEGSVQVTAPYAAIRNMEPGSSIVIHPTTSKALKFSVDGSAFFSKYVVIQGNAFFTRAWRKAMAETAEVTTEAVALFEQELAEAFDESLYKISDSGRRTYIGGPIKRSKRIASKLLGTK